MGSNLRCFSTDRHSRAAVIPVPRLQRISTIGIRYFMEGEKGQYSPHVTALFFRQTVVWPRSRGGNFFGCILVYHITHAG